MSEEISKITEAEVVELVEYIAKSLVDRPEEVKVIVKPAESGEAAVPAPEGEEGASEDDAPAENQVTIELSVAKDDMGKVIGKQGRIAKAIRTVVRAATVKSDVKYRIDIL